MREIDDDDVKGLLEWYDEDENVDFNIRMVQINTGAHCTEDGKIGMA